ncbi:MAG: tautomerase family protein [Veillonellaceae bacterium]|nr:tautomerase family protein [Veillonellaceae bacterium]
MPVIQVSLIKGRTAEQKRAFARAVTEATVTHLACPHKDVTIVLHEIEKEDLAHGGVLRCDE